MAKKNQQPKQVEETDNHYREYGQTNQERIVERTSKAQSRRHRCKGPKCVDAFQD